MITSYGYGLDLMEEGKKPDIKAELKQKKRNTKKSKKND